MADVYQYLKTPANDARLKPQEIPTKEELDPFLPIVSKDQLASLRDLLAVARLTAGGEEGPEI